jgi:sterol desaturase/sphingolipid hydroxylase (fatty acid hydroxylase superfamily)
VKHTRTVRKGVGLYTYEQVKNTTAFAYFAQAFVGTVIAALGALILYHEMVTHRGEVRKYGSPEADVWAWIVGLVVLIIGLFMAHAGVIFWARRVYNRFALVRRSHEVRGRRYRDG